MDFMYKKCNCLTSRLSPVRTQYLLYKYPLEKSDEGVFVFQGFLQTAVFSYTLAGVMHKNLPNIS